MIKLNVLRLDQVWANYGLGARCGTFSFLMRPAKLVQIIIIMLWSFPCNAHIYPIDGVEKGYKFFSLYEGLLHVIYLYNAPSILLFTQPSYPILGPVVAPLVKKFAHVWVRRSE